MRWGPDNFEWVARVPWNRGRAVEEAGGEVPHYGVKSVAGRVLTEQEKQDSLTNGAQKTARQAYLRRTDFEKHGYTGRCAGCSAILRGTQVQPHPGACRRRMEQLREGEARV